MLDTTQEWDTEKEKMAKMLNYLKNYLGSKAVDATIVKDIEAGDWVVSIVAGYRNDRGEHKGMVFIQYDLKLLTDMHPKMFARFASYEIVESAKRELAKEQTP